MDKKRKAVILERGIECFNRREFFDCHEVLEEVWLAETLEEKSFYQGLIQVAAAFHHYQSGNRRGACSLLQRGREKLAALPSPCHGVDLSSLLPLLADWQEKLNQEGGDIDLALPVICAMQ
jgi:predicted metal-dependent hydrolase